MPWNYGFFIRGLRGIEKRIQGKSQVNEGIERLNGKENGMKNG
jgi:hypothetical protein